MTKTTSVRARMQPDLKEHVERIFRKIGISTTQAITLFYKQVEMRRGIPFDIVMPNRTTKRTFETTDAGQDVILCENTEDMFKHLGI